jgi:sucrose phosphorylase
VAARAIQLFARGVPQIYYVGLLAGENDHRAVDESGEGRSINRHDYTTTEVETAVRRPVVQRVLDLVRLRNSEPAFSGRLDVSTVDPGTLRLTWRLGDDVCELEVDLRSGGASITTRHGDVEHRVRP